VLFVLVVLIDVESTTTTTTTTTTNHNNGDLMMRYLRKIPLVCFALTLFTATLAQAAWTGTFSVTQIQYNDHSSTQQLRVWLGGKTCDAPGSADYYTIKLSRGEEHVAQMAKILVSARLSGEQVSLGYSHEGSICDVYAINF